MALLAATVMEIMRLYFLSLVEGIFQCVVPDTKRSAPVFSGVERVDQALKYKGSIRSSIAATRNFDRSLAKLLVARICEKRQR